MADWYVSSVAYAAIPVWQASTAYSVGDIIRPVTPANAGSITGLMQVPYRCTTAGTSGSTEPTWGGSLTDGATIASGGATFTCVGGRSAHGWAAAAGNLYCITGNPGNSRFSTGAGDRVFVSSDHSETYVTGILLFFTNFSASYGQTSIISVNRAGSVPPVLADITPGATITINTTGNLSLDPYSNVFWQGFTFVIGATNPSGFFSFSSSGYKALYFKDCGFQCNGSRASYMFVSNNAVKVIFDNTSVKFSLASQSFNISSTFIDFLWINTATPLGGGTVPTTLFTMNGLYQIISLIARGCDFSALNTVFGATWTSGSANKLTLDSCKVNATMNRLGGTPSAGSGVVEDLEYINCHDGTSIINERLSNMGTTSIDRTAYMSGGAADETGTYSMKLVSTANSSKHAAPLESWWIDVGNSLVGASKTATVEIISSGSLNTDDINLLLEYMGTAGNTLATLATGLTSPIAAGTALPTSSVVWIGASGTKMKLQVTFTPQVAGRVRGLVRLGKASTTVYVNPQITIT